MRPQSLRRWLFLMMLIWMPIAFAAELPQGAGVDDRRAASQGLPFKQEEPVVAPFLGKALLALLLLLAVAAGILMIVRRYMRPVLGAGTGESQIELIEMRRLTPKIILFLVRVRGREVLLAQNGDSLIAVGEEFQRMPADGREEKQ